MPKSLSPIVETMTVYRHHYGRLKKAYKIFAFCITAMIIVAIIAAIIYFLATNDDGGTTNAQLARGAVVTNGHGCAKIGVSVLEKGGTAVDAAIASLFCEGVSMPQSMGLGGGFLMTIYLKEKKTAITLNAREMAPAGATLDMYKENPNLATKGGLAAGVPGELKGYWEAYKKYGGNVPWKDLVQPTIDLCRNGILVTPYLAKLYSSQFNQLYKDPYLREEFIKPETNSTYRENEYVKRTRLANALEVIAKEGGDALHNGSLTKGFVEDIQENGGIITEEDMNNYQPIWEEPIKADLPFNQVMYTSPLPGSGVVLTFMFNLLNDFLDYSDPLSLTNWQRIVETFKYAYGKRTELGDPAFVDNTQLVSNLTSLAYADEVRKGIYDNETFNDPEHYGANTTQIEDHGTAHVCILAPNGDAVSVTSTINLYFGAGFMSKTTGIILNDEMDDFSSPYFINQFNVPPSPANFIEPKKRPMSSMCPTIIVDKDGDVRLVIGAAGGTKITTSVLQIAVKHLWFNISVEEAVNDRRLHHQLLPMRIDFEYAFNNDLDFVNSFRAIGHNCSIAGLSDGFSAVTAISRRKNVIESAADVRRTGEKALVF